MNMQLSKEKKQQGKGEKYKLRKEDEKSFKTGDSFKQYESCIGGSKREKAARVLWNRHLKLIFGLTWQ